VTADIANADNHQNQLRDNPPQPSVLVSVSGGVVQDVRTNNPAIKVLVIDWDEAAYWNRQEHANILHLKDDDEEEKLSSDEIEEIWNHLLERHPYTK